MAKVSTIIDDQSPFLFKLLKEIEGMEVFVGIPEERTDRKNPPVGNATLMYIHTHGSPKQNIPARPVIEPALTEKVNKAKITEELGDAVRSMVDKEPEKARNHLNRAGSRGANAARDWFENPKNGWPPLSPLTVAKKGSERPLIDTAQLRRSITYVPSKKG